MDTYRDDIAELRELTGMIKSPTSMQALARHRWHVTAGCRVPDLADALQRMPEIRVVAVLDGGDRYLGMVERSALFAMLGKPFGRDVLKRSLVSELMVRTPCIDRDVSVFDLPPDPGSVGARSPDAAFLALQDHDARFAGLVEREDIARFLAEMTRNDIELAARLQERLEASSGLSDESACRVSVFSSPAQGVGGDFHFCRNLPDGRVFATLCDVSGKGVSAAIIVTLAWGILKAFDYRQGMRKLIKLLNSAIVETFHMERYLTGVFLIHDSARKRTVIADMGHSHVSLLRGGRCLPLRSGQANLPVGLDPRLEPRLFSVTLRPGDRLVMHSDGITEQTDADGREFGEERLMALLRSRHDKGIDSILEAIQAESIRFRGPIRQQDDMSCMIISFDE